MCRCCGSPSAYRPATKLRKSHDQGTLIDAFMVSPQDMDELTNARSKRSKAVAEFEAWSQRAALSALPASVELTDQDVLRMVKKLR